MDNNSMDFHNIVDTIEHNKHCKQDCKVKKMKESILLLKRKMYKTHDLIKQYSENMKEIDYLKSNLEIAKKEAKHTISNYKSAMDKIRELELKIVEDKEKAEKLMNKINEYDINIAADKQIIQQLTCKIKDLEEEHSGKIMEYDLEKSYFEDKIKDLEHELKKLKGTAIKKREKKIILMDVDTAKPNIGTKSSSDIGINVSLCDNELSAKREVQDKSILTDEFYNIKNDPHPLFCAKCEAHLPPDLTPEKIYKTMSTYPKLIEKDLSPLPKKIYSPSCSLSSTYPNSINRNEDALSRISSMSHLRPYSPFSDLIVGNPKFQSGRSSAMTQISENLELRNVDISHIPVANLSNNLSSVPTFTLSQSRNCAREDFCSDNLLIEHSSSIKEMERKIRLLESKMKKFRRLKEKINSCRCITNYKDDISLNSNLISIICKGMAEYYNEKREACSKKEQNINSEKCTCVCCIKKIKLKKRQQSDKCDAFSWEVENFDEKHQVRNTICNKTENATTDILQSENILSVHKNNSFSDINTSSTSLNDIESDKRKFVSHEKNTLHSAEVALVEDNLTTSYLSADDIYASDNLLSRDNVEAINRDNQTEIGMMSLSNDENFVDDKIVDINIEKNKITRKIQNIYKDKVGEIYISDNLLGKDNVEVVNKNNQTEVGMMSLSNDENSIDYADDKIVDINIEKSKIKRKSQNIYKDKVGEIYASDNLLSKDNVEAADMDNHAETGTISLSNENFIDDANGKIIDINAEENERKRKGQNIHDNKIGEICANDKLLSKDNVEAINMDTQSETGTIFLSNNERSTDHAVGKIIDINAEESKIKRKSQNIHKDKVGEVYASDNLLSRDNVKTIDTDNQTEIETIFLSNNENSTDHAIGKIVDFNVEENKINRKDQNIHKDKVDEIYTSDNLSNKDNIEAINMDNQTDTGMTILSNDENFIDSDDEIVYINAEENKIKRKDIYKDKIDEICTSDNVLIKDNLEAIDMDNQTETRTTSLSNDEDSIGYADDKIVEIINTKNSKVKRKGQNVHKNKVGNRLLKKIRSLKRKTQTNIRINKQENIESCSDHNSEYNGLAKKPRIENGEKIDDYPLESSKTVKKKLDTQAESINEQEHNESCSDYYAPAKKLRIAHTPKTSISQLSINENNFTHSTIRSISTLATRRKANGNQQLNIPIRKGNLLTESEKSHTINKKYDEKNMIKSIETNSIDRKPTNKKDLDLTSAEDCFQNNNITNEFKKHDVFIKNTCNRSIAMDRVTGDMSNNNDKSNVLHNNITNDTTNDLESVESIPLRTCIITESESSILCKNTKHDKFTEALETIEIRKKITMTSELESAYETLGNKSHNAISNDELSILHDGLTALEATRNKSHNNNDISDELTPRSPSPTDSNTIVEDTNDNNLKKSLDEIKNAINKREKTCINNETIEIQAIETRGKNVRMNQRNKEKKFIDISHHDDEESQNHNNNDIPDEVTIRSPSPRNNSTIFEYCINDNNMKESLNEIQHKTTISHYDVEESQMPMLRLIKYINTKHIKKHKLPYKKMRYVCKIADKYVKKQLQRLVNNSWEDSIHDDVIEKLGTICGPRIIAKCTVEFLLEEIDHSEALDKSFTPPAPMMTPSEQKIITLLIDLETSKPTVIHFVQAAIEYSLFRLNTDVKTTQVESLTRIYVVLSRIQKDRERIRMMCCNALYCMGLKSIGVLYTVLTCWPEVFPNAEVHKGILPKCIAFLIDSQHINDASVERLKRLLSKLNTLKRLMTKFYNYAYIKETRSDIVKELMTALKAERIDGLDTAIILVAKREGSSWTYKNIIESALLPMIIKNEHPCVYSAFALLGKLLRAFPLQDENNIVKEISEQLCDLIQSGQGSHDQQEGIISALLHLSRHKFDVIAPCVIKWMPSKSLRPIINTQLQAFINTHNSKFWKNYLQREHIELIQRTRM